MLKKSLSIILSVVMLIALCPAMTVSAALPQADIDNFEQYTEEITTAFAGYPKSSLNQTSNIFVSNANGVGYTLVKHEDASGETSMMLKTVGTANHTHTAVKSITHASGQLTRFTYDICFEGMPETIEEYGTTLTLAKEVAWYGYGVSSRALKLTAKPSGDNIIYTMNSISHSTGCVIEQGHWYRIICTVDGSGFYRSYFTDAATGEILTYAANTSAALTTISMYACFLNGTHTPEASYLIDNAELLVYTPSASYAPEIVKTSTGNTGVPVDAGTMEITFDQPIKIAPTSVTLTATGKEPVMATVSNASAIVGSKLNTYTLILPTLEGGTTYTADLSDFKNDADAVSTNYSFTTGAAAPVIAAVTPENGAVNVSVETKSVSLTFDQSIAKYPSELTLSGGATDITASVTTTDNTNFTASWSEELAGNTTYTLNLGSFTNANGVACSTKSISFTTEITDIITETDTFENSSLLSVNSVGYATKGQSPLTMPTTTSYGADESPADILTQVERGTGTALSLKTGSAEGKAYLTPLRTYNTYSVADGEKLVATWRFNLKQMGTVDGDTKKIGAQINIGCSNGTWLSFGNTMTMIYTKDGKPFLNHSNDNAINGTEISENHWYNVVYVLENANQFIYVIDSQTGEIVYRREKAGKSNEVVQPLTAEQPAYVYIYSGARTAEENEEGVVTSVVNDSQEFLVDDFTMWRINPEKTAQKLSLVTADKDAIIKKDGKLSMTFNQPVLANSGMLELYKGTTKNELAYSTANVKYTDFCTQEVSFSNLQYLTDYTLDYSGMTAVSGADLGDGTAAATLSFSTEADPNEMSITSDISCTGLSTGDTVSFDLYSKASGTAKVIAAFYERSFPGKLASVEMADASVTAGESSEVEITLTKEHKADYIKVFVWDGLTSLVPMSRVYEVHAPVDTLDVLMIGNSLSEDAGRYLNNVAEADGLTLNLTVKGVGGASLDNHAANLKAELAGRTAAEAQEQMNAGTVERALYFTYENGVYQAPTAENQLLTDALKNKQYDVISLQQFSAYTDAAFEDSLPYLAEEIRKLQPNAEIILYQTWSPYSGDRNTRNYYFTNTIEPAVEKWTAYTGANVENITVNGEPMKIVSAGKAFYLADNKYDWCGTKYTTGDGNTDEGAKNDTTTEMKASLGLWRDYNHASYYGCYLADAVWYEILTGKKAPVGTEAAPVVASPDGVTAKVHIERLTQLSDIAHQVVMEQSN